MSSCKKNEVETFAPTTPPPAKEVVTEDYVPVYPSTDAVLVSIKNISLDEDGNLLTENTAGNARAIFPTEAGNLVNAGEVLVQNNPLELGIGNQYTYANSSLSPLGISFPDNKIRWNISGNANVPDMNLMNTDGFPGVSSFLDNPETVDRSQDFTLGLTEHIQNADSVRYTIAGTNGYIYASDWAVNNSVTFTPAKLKQLDAGKGTIKITAFRTVTMSINQKVIQAINQTVIIKKITIL